jgi:hypothetical protein
MIVKYFNLVLILASLAANAQKGDLSGQVIDADSESAIPFATIIVENSASPLGAVCDENGNFLLQGLNAGRYNITASVIGYAPARIMEVMVNPGKMSRIEFRLKEAYLELGEAEVQVVEKKEEALNSMAIISARQLNAEEARRYAGGFDDPARLVTAFAGVAGNIGSNGIVIRGNSPKGVLWRLEGMPISNPNHFAEVSGIGAGGVTALSSQMLASSDFFTGAFPAEYGNALSGVFDLNLRNGNNLAREHTFQAGILGIDFASEGPFKLNQQSSYLFNYRYSTFGLIQPLLPEEAGKIGYQDLSFKLNFPDTRLGQISIWSLGLMDVQDSYPEKDSLLWHYEGDNVGYHVRLNNGVVGVSSKKYINEDLFLKNSFSISGDEIGVSQFVYAGDYSDYPDAELSYRTTNYRFQSLVNAKLTSNHTNRSGILINKQHYNIDINSAEEEIGVLEPLVQATGDAWLLQGFSQSSFRIMDNFQLISGLNLHYFSVNEDISIEPRVAFRYAFSNSHKISLAYGKHSQTERLNFYLEDIPSGQGYQKANRDLAMSKAHHVVLGYDRSLTEFSRLKVELYYQHLYDIPVIADSSFSMLNLKYDWFTGSELNNDGKGENYGLEITLERFLNKGWFYILTASFFDSNYLGGDGRRRSTVYDQEVIANLMLGKEWIYGKDNNKIVNLSARYTYMGGEKIIPVDEIASLEQQLTVLEYHDSYSQQAPGRNLLHLSFSYRINHKKFSGIWSVQVLNALGSSEYFGDQYNTRTQRIDRNEEVLVIPNIGYKIEW